VLELYPFQCTGSMPIVVIAMAYVSLARLLGRVLNRTGGDNQIGALRPAVWAASFGLLSCSFCQAGFPSWDEACEPVEVYGCTEVLIIAIQT